MSFFISDALAQSGGAETPGLLGSLLPMIVIIAIFYFMLIRPQMKRTKEHKNMVAELDKGDEVVTNGGVLGKITKVGENYVSVEIAQGVVIRLQRTAVSSVMPKGTIKAS